MDIKTATKILAAGIPARSMLPVLRTVLAEPVAGGTRLTATDLDIGVQVIISDALVTAPTVIDWTVFKATGAAVQAGVLLPADFPTLPAVDGQDAGVSWIDAAARVARCVSKASNSRLALQYIHLDAAHGCAVATDGCQLRMSDTSDYTGPSALLPPKFVELVQAAGTPDNVVIGETVAEARYPWGRILSKISDEQYPNYRRVIPDACRYTQELAVPRDAILAACKAAKDLAKKDGSVLFHAGKVYAGREGAFHAVGACVTPAASVRLEARLFEAIAKECPKGGMIRFEIDPDLSTGGDSESVNRPVVYRPGPGELGVIMPMRTKTLP